jgi:hypothetical protein
MVVEDYIVDLDLGVGIVLHGLMYLVRIIVGVLDLDLDLEIRKLLIISVFIYGCKNRRTARIIFLPLPITHTQSTHSSINPNSGRTNMFLSLSPIIRRSITSHETRNLLGKSTSSRITSMLRLLPLNQLLFKSLMLLLHLPSAIEHSKGGWRCPIILLKVRSSKSEWRLPTRSRIG